MASESNYTIKALDIGLNDNFSTTEPNALDLIASSKLFTAVHSVAFASGFTSLIVSVSTLIYLFHSGKKISFWKRKQGERMVVYLALSDIGFGAEHMSSHIMNIVTVGDPPHVICVISGFLFQLFVWTQAIVVLLLAASAFILVKCNIKLRFGRYDHRLLLPAIVVPSLVCTVYACLGYLGPSGYWCYADVRIPEAYIVYEINGGVMIVVAALCAFLYLGVWIQISVTNRGLKSVSQPGCIDHHVTSYQKTAKILICFVVVYLAQWWPFIVYPIWNYFETPHVAMVILIVLFANQGGTFNFFAYTFIRRVNRKSTTPLPTLQTNTINAITLSAEALDVTAKREKN